MQCDNLSEYLESYGTTLIDSVKDSSDPLWSETGDIPELNLLREPMPAQWQRIMAIKAAWDAGRSGDVLSADMGVGKTIMASVAVHAHANGKPYRAVVVCPPHLPKKWQRELLATIPGANVVVLEKYSDVLGLSKVKPTSPEWFIMSGNKAKLSTPWVPSFVKKKTGLLHCPECDMVLKRKVVIDGGDVMMPCTPRDLSKNQKTCECGSALYQWTHKFDRWPIASIIQKQERRAFTYLVLDEIHETKGERTAIGMSVGKLASTIPYVIGLTGTLLNGYADSIMPMSFRLYPRKMKELGLKFGDTMGFVKRYGRIETIETFKDQESYANRMSRGGGKSTTVKIKPGIVPSLYGDCMLENSVFCALEDLNYDLPKLTEFMDEVPMDDELGQCYSRIESEIRGSIGYLLRQGSKGAMSTMLNTLLGWPDHPYNFGAVGYHGEDGRWVNVCEPPNLDPDTVRNKEQKLVDVIVDAANRGRQSWIYCEMTQKHDVQERIKRLLSREGLDVRILRSKQVPTGAREDWIFKNGKANVIISNPSLVRTGFDLFDRGGNHNFSTLMFYQTGYRLDTLRQASARSYRIGQTLDCEVRYLYYGKTMQTSAMKLMSEKTIAAKALDGKFSSSALTALSNGGGETAAMMLAKMLVARSDSLATAV